MIRRTCAIVLTRQPFSNTSLIVAFATEQFGLVRTLAKGARRSPRRRFARTPEPFARGELLFYPRRGDSLAIAAEWSEEEARRGLFSARRGKEGDGKGGGEGRGSAAEEALSRLSAAHASAEIMGRVTRESSPDPDLFSRFDRALSLIAASSGWKETAAALLRFEMEALAALGALPDLSACSACGRDLLRAPAAWLRPTSGGPDPRPSGLLCGECVPAAEMEDGGGGDGGGEGEAVRMSAGSLAVARLLSRAEEFPLGRLRMDRGQLRALSRAFSSALSTFLECRLRCLGRLRKFGLA